MDVNRFLTFGSLVLLILVISVPSVLTVKKRHEERLIYVTEVRIKETANKCFIKGLCQNKKIELKELYNLKYLRPQVNPISKEYYNENSYVLIEKNKIEFIDIGAS